MSSNIFPRRGRSRPPVALDGDDLTLLEPSSGDKIDPALELELDLDFKLAQAFPREPPVPVPFASPPGPGRQARDRDSRPAPQGDVPTREWSRGDVTGQRLGAYMMYEELARGGMATVHLGRASSPEGGRIVAIKRLNSELARNPNAVAMFVEEGRTAARIRHPNVVSPIDFVFRVIEGEVFLVMEYVHGETLADLLAAGFRQARHPSSQVAVGIMVGALRGLQAAHDATTPAGTPMGIVHRDVSPQNIMVGADGAARLLDFGVAKVVSTEELSGDDRDQWYKPSYVAPEQVRGQRVDRRADIFSAGVVLWEILAGRRLFSGKDRRFACGGSLDRDTPPPSRFNSVIPSTLDAVVLGALERDPARRFASAGKFSSALITAIEPARAPEIAAWVEHVSGARLARRAERVAHIIAGDPSLPSAGSKALPVEARRARRWVRARAWKILAPACLLTVALAWVGLWSTSGAAFPRTRSASAASSSSASASAASASSSASSASSSSSRWSESHSSELPTPLAGHQERPASPSPRVDLEAGQPVVTHEISAPAPAAAVVAAPDEKDAADAEYKEPAPRAAGTRGGHRPAKGRLDAVAEIVSLNHRALQAYRGRDLGNALKLLQTALAASARSGLNYHRSSAVTHAELAAVLVVGFNQSQLGIEHFRRAFRIDPRVRLAQSLRTPETVAAYRQAAGAAPVRPEA